MKRTHDEFYLLENSQHVKQSFVEVADEIEQQSFLSVADVGCAAGAFPNYLKERFSSADVTGIEYLQSLLSKAKSDFHTYNF